MDSPDDIARHLSRLRAVPLPGTDEHTRVILPYRQDLIERYRDIRYRPAAVLVLTYPGERGLETVLIRRYTYDGVHSGQMAFPGGKAEPGDRNLIETALREAREEVNIRPGDVEIIRSLTPVKIPVSRFEVTPVWGFTRHRPDFRPQPGEVAAIHPVSWDYLMNEPWQQETRPYEGRSYPILFLPLDGQQIWGATAMVIAELRHIWQQAR